MASNYQSRARERGERGERGSRYFWREYWAFREKKKAPISEGGEKNGKEKEKKRIHGNIYMRLFGFNGWFAFLYFVSIVIIYCIFIWKDRGLVGWRKPFVHAYLYLYILVRMNIMHRAYMITIRYICFSCCIKFKWHIWYMHVFRGASLETSSTFI